MRLIMIASCPGEEVPPWPSPTHGPGRRPYVTEAHAIDRLPPDPRLHDIQAALRRGADLPVRNPNAPFPRTLTCTEAGKLGHYSGKRHFTAREAAGLQAFPPRYQCPAHLRVTTVRKQIGNAYPPCVAKAIFQGVRQHLERVDRQRRLARGLEAAVLPGAPATPPSRRRNFPGSSGRGARSQGPPSAPSYSALNADLDDDDAFEAALRASRHTNDRNTSAHQTIVIDTDDDDKEEEELQGPMGRLSVEPTPPARDRFRSVANLASPYAAASTSTQPAERRVPGEAWDSVQRGVKCHP